MVHTMGDGMKSAIKLFAETDRMNREGIKIDSTPKPDGVLIGSDCELGYFEPGHIWVAQSGVFELDQEETQKRLQPWFDSKYPWNKISQSITERTPTMKDPEYRRLQDEIEVVDEKISINQMRRHLADRKVVLEQAEFEAEFAERKVKHTT